MLVSIDQCYFRGSELGIAKARQALEQSHFPSVSDTEYVILRRLDVTAELPQLGKNYFLQSEQIISGRVYGWTDAAVDADCVWFASEIDMLACLSNDIALGRAGSRWFWKSYSRFTVSSVADGLSNLFQQQSKNLSNLIHRMYEQGVLSRVWNVISDSMAATLIDLSVAETVNESIRNVFSEHEQTGHIKITNECPPLLSILLSSNTQLLNSPTARQQLAIILYLQLDKPHWLQSASSVPLISQFIQQITNISWTIKDDSKSLSRMHKTEAAGFEQYEINESKLTQLNKTENQQLEINQPPVKSDRVSNLTDESSGLNTSDSNKDEQVDEQLDKLNDIDELPDPQDKSAAGKQWFVTQGGIFYLLNILNQPVIRQQLLNDVKALAFPSGWGWLYRLGEAFGLQPEAQLLCCLSTLSGLDKNEFLTTTPDLEIAQDILAYAERRYSGYGIWKPDLLLRQATIVYSRPELSIIFAMQDIDIDLRKSGLDIDPVWIDWLGTVVCFHYREVVQ